ncbi:MAG: DUF2169 domain-containing protein [Planctomycetes bacterium]|nr:DUF2169 domain-containing protein [Planctomycetota bacterium]
MDIIDDLGVACRQLVALDGEGFEVLVVLVKANFDLARLDGGVPALARAHDPIELADRYRGKPESSSLLCAAEGAPFKPATDVLLSGHARPRQRGQVWGEVEFEFAALAKRATVCGPRLWKRGLLGGAVPADPAPFEGVALTWENTFGGVDTSYDPPRRFEPNPAGSGFRPSSKAELRGTPAPQVEHPDASIESAGSSGRAQGFGPIAPFWAARAQYAGTYDEAWMKSRMPLLPADFDARFHQVAPPDQILPGYIRGGERVRIRGMSAGGELAFQVPAWRPDVGVFVGDELRKLAPRCDTVHIDTDRMTMSLLFRDTLRIHGRLAELCWVHVSAEERRG